MKQRRLNDLEKIELTQLWESKNWTIKQLSEKYAISSVAIIGLLKRRGYKMLPQTELQRKYPINETFFDTIDTQEKAYILGLLYADGYNNTDRNYVNLSLQESDKAILDKITELIQPTKPIMDIKKTGNCKNVCCILIANKHISKRLSELGCTKAKTFNIIFPTEEQVPSYLHNHFIRGYFDGDGYIGILKQKIAIDIVGTLSFCDSLQEIFKEQLFINAYMRQRYPERNNNIWSIAISGNKQILLFLEYIYRDSIIHLERKYQKYQDALNIEPLTIAKKTICANCDNAANQITKDLCRKCYYKLNNGSEKRKLRFKLTGQ